MLSLCNDITSYICSIPSSRIILVLDIPSAFLPESTLDINTVVSIVEALSICKKLAFILINPFMGTHIDVVKHIEPFKKYDKIGLIVNTQDLDVANISIFSQGLRSMYTIEIFNLSKYGDPMIVSLPRTSDFAPLLLSTALYSLYIVKNRDDRLMLNQGFIATNINIARIFVSQPARYAVLDIEKIVHGDGPIYGLIDYIKNIHFKFIVGDPLYVDVLFTKSINMNVETIGCLWVLSKVLNISESQILKDFHYENKCIYGVKLKLHQFYNFYRNFWRKYKENIKGMLRMWVQTYQE